MSAEYSEDQLVQQTTADKFQDLGWESIFAHNEETYGEAGTLGRSHEGEVLLKRDLRAALERLNPGHPDTAYSEAIEKLSQTSSSKTLLQHNQEKYQLIRDGIRVSYTTARSEKREPSLRLIDFQQPENNRFLVVSELWIQGKVYRRRPDIIGFVNGIPLLFIELKRTSRDLRVAYNRNFSDYQDTIPELFHYNAIVLLSNMLDCKAGSLTSPFEFFHEWKRLQEKEVGRVDWETMLMGICTPANFLDLVQNFLFFDAGGKKGTVKILARNHQYLGVNQTFNIIRNRHNSPTPNKIGVFWHTQGSGKSYSMAFLSEKVHRLLPGNYTFLIVTDRVELDQQIASTFANLGASAGNTQATSGAHLTELLKQNHRYVFTLIHKFNQPGTIYSQRNNIIVMCDEAHRTQYGILADNMRHGLPNAAFIAFTGTPLMDSPEDQLTRQTFGDYVSTYDFQRAIADGATVPLYYDNRGEKLMFQWEGKEISVANSEELNEKIAAELNKHDLDEKDEAAIWRRLKKDYMILTAPDRLDRIAEDLVAHYIQRWPTGKAMLVCLDKITAVRMHRLIDKYWKQAIAQQQQRVKQATDDQDAIAQQSYLDWLQETEYIVVISESQNEVKTFQEWGLDIEPHREKIKNRPLDDDFKDRDHPFRLAIVCAMWLTGFDVKSLGTLYIDKPMRGHNLMQTIARANRVDEGKDNGLLVDYNGILKSLRDALSKYACGTTETAQSQDDTSITEDQTLYPDVEEELRNKYQYSIQACINHIHNFGCDLQQLIDATGFDKSALLDGKNKDSILNAICTNDESRARFDVLARQVFQKKRSLMGYDDITREYQQQYNAIDAIYKQLHQTKERSPDLNAVLRSLQENIGEGIIVQREREPGAESGNVYDISQIDWDLLKASFRKSSSKNLQVQSLKNYVQQQLNRMLEKNQSQRRLSLYERYHKIVNDYNRETDQVAIEQTFEALMHLVRDISEEDSRAVRENLNPEHLAIFDLLCENKENLSPRSRDRIKKVARSLLLEIKASLETRESWQNKESTQAQVRQLIYNILYDEIAGLPINDYEEKEIEEYTNVIYLHVFRQYGRASSQSNVA